jgi:hypothetical protein
MYKRMLRSVLATVFSAAVVFGAISGAGLGSGQAGTELSADSGWTRVQAGPPDSGWTSTPAKTDA